MDGKRPQENSTNEAEHDGGSGDAERERRDNGSDQCRRTPKAATGEVEILPEVFDRHQSLAFPRMVTRIPGLR